MAYRETLTDTAYLSMFAPPGVVAQVEAANKNGQKVEMEYTSFNDPGPDECRVMIDNRRIFTIPGY